MVDSSAAESVFGSVTFLLTVYFSIAMCFSLCCVAMCKPLLKNRKRIRPWFLDLVTDRSAYRYVNAVIFIFVMMATLTLVYDVRLSLPPLDQEACDPEDKICLHLCACELLFDFAQAYALDNSDVLEQQLIDVMQAQCFEPPLDAYGSLCVVMVQQTGPALAQQILDQRLNTTEICDSLCPPVLMVCPSASFNCSTLLPGNGTNNTNATIPSPPPSLPVPGNENRNQLGSFTTDLTALGGALAAWVSFATLLVLGSHIKSGFILTSISCTFAALSGVFFSFLVKTNKHESWELLVPCLTALCAAILLLVALAYLAKGVSMVLVRNGWMERERLYYPNARDVHYREVVRLLLKGKIRRNLEGAASKPPCGTNDAERPLLENEVTASDYYVDDEGKCISSATMYHTAVDDFGDDEFVVVDRAGPTEMYEADNWRDRALRTWGECIDLCTTVKFECSDLCRRRPSAFSEYEAKRFFYYPQRVLISTASGLTGVFFLMCIVVEVDRYLQIFLPRFLPLIVDQWTARDIIMVVGIALPSVGALCSLVVGMQTYFFLKTYRRDILDMRQGKYFFDSTRYQVFGASKLIAYQVIHTATSWILIFLALVLFVTPVVLLIIYVPAFREFARQTALSALLFLVSGTAITKIVNWLLVQIAFRSRGLIVNIIWWHIYDFWFSFLSFTLAISAALVRFAMGTMFQLIFLSRLDTSAFPRGWQQYDPGYAAYISTLLMDHQYNNPIFVVASQHWVQELEALQLTSMKRQRRGSNGEIFEAMEDVADEFCANKCARNRWHLFVTLSNNPSLLPFRKHNLGDTCKQGHLRGMIQQLLI